MKSKVIAVIMGGGRGTRLYPLTKLRCKPAAPLGGKYRLVDIPISNCLNAGINRIFVLTQFNTASLHNHIQSTYKFDPFGGGMVDILSAEQTEQGENWYQGTADAVRQNLHHFNSEDDDIFLILSGDQLYKMDLIELVQQHRDTGAAITIAAKAVPKTEVEGLGLMRIKENLEITEFVEKPKDPKVIDSLVVPEELEEADDVADSAPKCLANMGIYVFNREVLDEALTKSEAADFGREIIPGLLGKLDMRAYIFRGYWEDIGTVSSFFDANLSLTDPLPPFNIYEQGQPIFTRSRYLPPSKINRCSIDRALITDGCIINEATLQRCVIGLRSIIHEGAHLRNVVMMGSDFFEDDIDRARNVKLKQPDIGIGNDCHITNAIIDKNARIGRNVRLSPDGKPDNYEEKGITVRDGILIVEKNAMIADNTIV